MRDSHIHAIIEMKWAILGSSSKGSSTLGSCNVLGLYEEIKFFHPSYFSLHLWYVWGYCWSWAEISWPPRMVQATPPNKSAMKCLLHELMFFKWLLPHEEMRCSMEIMVCPLFLLKNKTCKVGQIILPMGTSNLCPTLQTKLPMNIKISAIYGSKNQWKKDAIWQPESGS